MESVGNLRYLIEDNEHYTKVFRSHGKLSGKNEVMERWCESVFCNDIVPKFDINIPNGEELRTLGVGSGSGEMERHLLKQLLKKFPRISNDVVDPSEELIAQYKASVSANSETFQGIDNHWHVKSFQEYKDAREKQGDEGKFHFISTIHSMNYFNNLGNWLDYLYDLLEKDGILLVIMVSETSGFGQMYREFLQPSDFSKQTYDCMGLTIGDACTHFKNRGIHYNRFTVPLKCDISGCFHKDPSTEADLLLDFYSNIVNFRKSATPEVREKFMQIFESEACTQRDGDHLFFIEDSGVMLVQKK